MSPGQSGRPLDVDAAEHAPRGISQMSMIVGMASSENLQIGDDTSTKGPGPGFLSRFNFIPAPSSRAYPALACTKWGRLPGAYRSARNRLGNSPEVQRVTNPATRRNVDRLFDPVE